MTMDASPGVELVLGFIRRAAQEQHCDSCDGPLAAARIEPETIDPECLVARLICPCGAAKRIEVRPTAEGGSAEVR